MYQPESIKQIVETPESSGIDSLAKDKNSFQKIIIAENYFLPSMGFEP